MPNNESGGTGNRARQPREYLDSNVILRFLLNDHTDHSPRAAALIRRAEAGEVTLAVSQHIICEVVFILEGEGYSRTDICGALTRFAAIKGITDLHSIASYRGGRLWTFNKDLA